MTRKQYELPPSGRVSMARGAGWGTWYDAQHVPGSPQQPPVNTLTLFTVDGLGANTNTDYLQTVPASIWQDNAINPMEVGEVYSVFISANVTTIQNATGVFEFGFNVGPLGGADEWATWSRRVLDRGVGVTQELSAFIPAYTASADGFLANGGRFYMRSDVQVQITAKRIFIQRTFSP